MNRIQDGSVMVTFYFEQINHKIIPLKILPFIRKFMVFRQIFDNFTIITGVIQLMTSNSCAFKFGQNARVHFGGCTS